MLRLEGRPPCDRRTCGLLGVETVLFVGNGFKCPLTAAAVRYGAEKGHAFNTLSLEQLTRYTFRFFGTLMALGLLLMTLRWARVIA